MLNDKSVAISMCLLIILNSLIGINGYIFECLDSCQCDTEEEIINCHSGTRARLFVPETRLRGFNIIRATNNNIRELPSEHLLLEKFPDLKAIDVEENADFNCSTLEKYRRINLLSDCSKSPEEIDHRVFKKRIEDLENAFGTKKSNLESKNEKMAKELEEAKERIFGLAKEFGGFKKDSKKQIEELEKKLRENEEKMEDKWQRILNETNEKLMAEVRKQKKTMRLELNPLLIDAVKRENLAGVRHLVNEGAFVNTITGDGKTMVHLAVESGKGNAKMVELLAEQGADLDAKDNDGFSPLHWAARNGKDRIVSMLIQKGADIMLNTNYGDTTLIWAVYSDNGSVDTVRILLTLPLDKYGEGGKAAYVNAQQNDGWTALHFAYKKKKMDIVKLLEENGAYGTIKNNDGKTPKQMY